MNYRVLMVQATGLSMYPFIVPGMTLVLYSTTPNRVKIGDIIAHPTPQAEDIGKRKLSYTTHRVIWKTGKNSLFFKGDNNYRLDEIFNVVPMLYSLQEVKYNGKTVLLSDARVQMLGIILLLYSYLSFVLPRQLLYGRRFFVRVFTGFSVY